jgi:hypothetical protein
MPYKTIKKEFPEYEHEAHLHEGHKKIHEHDKKLKGYALGDKADEDNI